MSADVIRWTGGPGSGKTYQLLRDVQHEYVSGRSIDDLCLMSFSRAQAADLAKRLHTDVFPRAKKTAIAAKCATIDASALRACRAAGHIPTPRDQIIQPGEKKSIAVYGKFMAENRIPYSPVVQASDDDDPVSRASLPAGNQIVELNAYLTATMQEPSDWMRAASALGLPFQGATWGIEDILAAWAEYKAKLGVYEHGDYVSLALDTELDPPAPVLFVDEFQDVSPLQNALIQHWIRSPETERVYVAGDPDQSIYGFRGCSPDLFLALSATDRGALAGDRPVSRRCPARVLRTAETLLGHQPNVSPTEREGISARATPRTTENLVRQIEEGVRSAPAGQIGSAVFVLCRFRRHATQIARAIAAAGIPTSGIRDSTAGPWGNAWIGRSSKALEHEAVNVWALTLGARRYLSGRPEPFPADEAAALVRATVLEPRRTELLDILKYRTAKRFPTRSGDLALWMGVGAAKLFEHLNLRPAIIEQIRNCIVRERQRGYEMSPSQVRVDTVHAAKGLECPVVLLHTGYLRGLLEGLSVPERAAEERRVYYVGATRASHALIAFDWVEPVWPVFGRAVV
jgi:superfamily I DNA/RNA helicase